MGGCGVGRISLDLGARLLDVEVLLWCFWALGADFRALGA